jgi:hypothetical protein
VLSESSYITAIAIYIGAACAVLLCLGWWLARHWRPAWVALVVLLGAALLFTPAHPEAGISTMAPALVVAVFQMLTAGPEAAEHALRPLAVMSGFAVGLTVLLRVTVFRRRRPPRQMQQAQAEHN